AALVVETQAAGAMRVPGEDGVLIVRVQPPDEAGLLLGEEYSAILGAYEAIGVVGPLPQEFPLGSCGDDARDRSDRHLLLRGRLTKSSASFLGKCGPAD